MANRFIESPVQFLELERHIPEPGNDIPGSGIRFIVLGNHLPGSGSHWPCILAEWYFKDPKPQLDESEMSPLAKVWKEVVGSPIIPSDTEERRKMKAYQILKPYIEAHEKMKKKS